MAYKVIINNADAVIIKDEEGRYVSLIDAIKASLRAAHDLPITSIFYDGQTTSLIDKFTGGLRNNSSVIFELTGETIKDESIFYRFFKFIKIWLSTATANSNYYDARETDDDSSTTYIPGSGLTPMNVKDYGFWMIDTNNPSHFDK